MTTSLKYLFSLIIGASMLTIVNCGSDNELSPVEVNTNFLIAHNWKLSSLKVDNTDQTSLYPNLTINFSPSGYTSTQGEPVWPASGTWTFDANGLVITRSDGVLITIQSISSSQMVFSLSWDKATFSGGRAYSISGNHVFTFIAP